MHCELGGIRAGLSRIGLGVEGAVEGPLDVFEPSVWSGGAIDGRRQCRIIATFP